MISQNIPKLVREAGVVGAGGAGFPTYVKLQAKVDHVIANGAECEPLLQKDRESMLAEQDAFFKGLSAMRQATGAHTVTVAVKRKNKDVADRFQPQSQKENVATLVYEDVYPAGDEYILAAEVTGKRIPPGGIPLAVGAVVDNVETIINIAHALEGRPVTHKYVTVCGAVKEPMTTRVPVGTSIQDCLNLAGGASIPNPVVLTGGVMMGGVAKNLSDPVTKAMGGLIVLPADHYLVLRKTQAKETFLRIGHGQCDQCSMCTELCPRYIMGYPIEPHRVMRTLLYEGEEKKRMSLWAQYCCECNVCSYIACPEQLDPKNICVEAKKTLREAGMSRTEEELKTLFGEEHPARRGREIPIKTLYTRLGLKPYDRKADFKTFDWSPAKVTIPLNSHVGAPAKAAVSINDSVRVGDVIGTVAEDQLGCPVHASINGTVTAVTDTMVEITA
jgi:Na+-translocating ferredoxin:NAD+ oxidoreductase RnfC subunit